ncbi:glycosyltransferase involved in cell wall biosynthesis [Micromonospora luteifusca]|uniref:Glycosyltransferase involved in cell wall biosynthesis n=1 Tax=Micromonospora luteifusca TaxID=709860 RepID=A0ABS2LY45_9ACTN|nr:glycosyltransferase family 2 protein [Micromonospora luteifusca]MBM7492789.1 glycosyltransferase involved in cell wall biosynthesis [Micromonospora luteifusca]
MSPAGTATVSVVVPTRNRSQLAYARAQWALSQPLVKQVVFVVDGSIDDTVARLQSLADQDARLQIIVNERNVGPPKAKNMGIRAATSEWVFIIDDDDVPSPNLIAELVQVANEAGADVVGVPWFNIGQGEDVEERIATAPRSPGGPKLEQPGIFPESAWADCVWMPANALFRRSVFEVTMYDEYYAGNYYREETDFFVSAVRAGHRVVVTDRGYTYIRSRTGGGIEKASKARYEYFVIRNNWYFLRKHGAWLRAEGLIRGSGHEQLSLISRRTKPLARAAGRRLTRWAR